jgi:hypothetical protein
LSRSVKVRMWKISFGRKYKGWGSCSVAEKKFHFF